MLVLIVNKGGDWEMRFENECLGKIRYLSVCEEPCYLNTPYRKSDNNHLKTQCTSLAPFPSSQD